MHIKLLRNYTNLYKIFSFRGCWFLLPVFREQTLIIRFCFFPTVVVTRMRESFASRLEVGAGGRGQPPNPFTLKYYMNTE